MGVGPTSVTPAQQRWTQRVRSAWPDFLGCTMNLEASLCYLRPCLDWVDGTVGGVLPTQTCRPEFQSPEPVFLLVNIIIIIIIIIKAKHGGMVYGCNPSSWQAEMIGSWGLLTSWLSQISEFQVHERPCLKKRERTIEEDTQGGYLVRIDLDVHTNRPHSHMWT